MNAYNSIRRCTPEEEAALLADLQLPIAAEAKTSASEMSSEIQNEETHEAVAEAGPIGPTGPIEQESDEAVTSNTSSVEEARAPEAGSADVTAGSANIATDHAYLPSGYAIFDDGTYEMPEDESAEPIFICTPIRVDAAFTDQNGCGWGRLISLKAANGTWHEVPVTNADLQRRPADVIAMLLDRGLDLAVDRKSKDRLLTLLKSWKPSEHLQTVNHAGWTNDGYEAFVLGGKVVGTAKVLPLLSSAGQVSGFSCDGSLEGWKVNVGMKCRDNPLMILAVSLAFSGPLLAPLGLLGGGLHFRGASSSGKTTLLNLASSVWGDRNLVSQWRATSNGLEAIAWSRNDMLLPLDEIAEVSARDLHNAIYMLANGTGKARMTKDVTLAEQARWRLALISSGEISVEEKLKEARLEAMAGHEVRLIDIEADSRAYGAFDHLHGAASAAAFAEVVQGAVRANHGEVGREFVRRLIGWKDGWEKLAGFADASAARWLGKLPSAPDGQISRVAKRFALIALAGDVATVAGLTGWEKGEAAQVAKQAFIDWYDRRYGAKREAAGASVKTLQDFLAANSGALVSPGPQAGGVVLGWRSGGHVYLPSSTWTKIYPGEEGAKAAKALLDMQLLLPGENGRNTRKAPRTIPNRPRVYTVNADRVAAYKAE